MITEDLTIAAADLSHKHTRVGDVYFPAAAYVFIPDDDFIAAALDVDSLKPHGPIWQFINLATAALGL